MYNDIVGIDFNQLKNCIKLCRKNRCFRRRGL